MTIENPYTTFNLMAIVMFALFLTIYEIFTKQIKCQKVDIENAGQDQEGENALVPIDWKCSIPYR